MRATDLWRQYLEEGRPLRLVARVGLLTGGYLALTIGLFVYFGGPHVPFRGNVSWWSDTVVIAAAVLVQVVLIFYVVDSTQLCERLIRNLSTSRITVWPRELMQNNREYAGATRRDKAELYDMRLLAERTRVIVRLIYYPFIIIVIMILARSRIFDNWDWPIALLLVFLINFSYAVYCQSLLWYAARCARQTALNKLRKTRARLDERIADQTARAKAVDRIISEIEAIRDGAFATPAQQPLTAILTAAGGLGIWQIIQQFLLTT